MEEGRAVTSLAQVAGTGRARDAAASRHVVDLGGVAGRLNDDGLMRSRGGRKGWTDSDEYRGGLPRYCGRGYAGRANIAWYWTRFPRANAKTIQTMELGVVNANSNFRA